MEFRKYTHVERFGSDEVQGIEIGTCFIFPKLDGTNASVWYDNGLCAGSRTRKLSIDKDNAGFYKWAKNNHKLSIFLQANQTYTIYGEWLVPHSLRTYRDNAWEKFYIFDIYDNFLGKYLNYEEYSALLAYTDIDFIRPLCVIKNANFESLTKELNKNTFLISDGEGVGEGIVIKNYNYVSKFGRTPWAKMITNNFTEKHTKTMGHRKQTGSIIIEQLICDQYLTSTLVNKTYAKIVNEMNGWNNKYIPRLLSTIYHDLITEEMWSILKKFKNPTINFKTLHSIAMIKIKERL